MSLLLLKRQAWGNKLDSSYQFNVEEFIGVVSSWECLMLLARPEEWLTSML